MVDEAQEQQSGKERQQTLSAAARKERLAELAGAIGESAVVDGDRVIVETGDPVALYLQVEPDGTIELCWWITASTSTGHPRWTDATTALLRPDEAIYTSALGGGFLVEVRQCAASATEAVRTAQEHGPRERVRELVAAFPDEVAALPPEPLPAYLLADREIS